MGNGESRRTFSLSFYDVLHHFGCSRSTVHSMQSNKIKTYFKIFSGTFSLSLPFCLSSFRFWFRFPFRRMLCILYIYLPLLCFLHFNIHILDAFFNDLLGLSVNETVFSTSTWFFGRLFFFSVSVLAKLFSMKFFWFMSLGFFLFPFWHFSSFLSPPHPPSVPAAAACCVLYGVWSSSFGK